MNLKINKVWFFYASIQIFYMFFALFVYANLTQLGDTRRYLQGPNFGRSDFWYNSTTLMDTVAHGLSFFLGPVLANLPFVLLSVYGIYYAVKRLRLSKKQLIILLGLLSFPSFSIWTSIASKEAVAVFFMGVITGYIIDLIRNSTRKNYLLVAIAFYLCAIFKPQYLIGITALLIYLFASRKLNLQGLGKLGLLGLFFISSFSILFLLKDQINELSFIIPAHFRLDAGSTRENTIWLEDYDVFWNAPYGMLISFIGPTLNEAFTKATHLLVWLESLVIIIAFVIALLKIYLIVLKTGNLNIFFISIFLTVTLWILFVHYPFGALNPGSAIRYRSNFYGFFVVLFYYLYTSYLTRYKMYMRTNIQNENYNFQS